MVTSTELRTKTPQVIATLLHGGTIDFVHRSKVIGEIRPKVTEPKTFNARKFLKLTQKLNLPPLTHQELAQNYREHIDKKYGQDISRH